MSTANYTAKPASKSEEILPAKPTPTDPSHSPLPYHSLSVGKKLSKAKFPVYLASSTVTNQTYAMKVYTSFSKDDRDYYNNEIRFEGLKHPNVIEIVTHEEGRDTLYRGSPKKISYILMEYAPHGDFFELMSKHSEQVDEKLVRTYFRQLIEGLEFLHGKGVAHLDLKLENLLLGKDFGLKIADFDLSHIFGDVNIISRGTRYYRGPELFRSKTQELALQSPFSADIFSAGVILYVLKSGGLYPQFEDKVIDGVNFEELLYKNNRKFWRKHRKFEGRKRSFYGKDFKLLFNNMVKADPRERYTIDQIKQSKWYNGPVYTQAELRIRMREILGI